MKNTHAFLALNHLPGMGPRHVLKLLSHWPELSQCFEQSHEALLQAGVSTALAQAICQFDWRTIEPDLQFQAQANQHVLTWEHPLYPCLLREIHDPPIVLYAIGDLACLQQPLLAMVGSRSPSPSGRQTAYEWAKQLSKAGLTIVSGLALGIDAAAHRGCLEASGPTIAVLGTGVNHMYPSSHRPLAELISKQGLILSEFPLNTAAKAGHFPRRNRIISGLSLATLVVEAALKSGSLITARFALEQNRDVLALPGSIHLPQAQGCHHLLKQGATLVTCYQDVLNEIGLRGRLTTPQQAASPPVSTQDGVLDCIGFEPTPIDTILSRSYLDVAQLTGRLAGLELEGLICAVPGGYIRCSP